MALDHPPHDGEADAGAFEVLSPMQALENAEQLVRILHLETGAVIANKYGDGVAVALKAADGDMSFG